MRRTLALAAAGVLVVAGWFLLDHYREGLPGAPTTRQQPRVVSTAATPINSQLGNVTLSTIGSPMPKSVHAPRGPASAERPEEPLPQGDFDLIRPELESRARSGDARAAFRLARIYRRCVADDRGESSHRLARGLSELLDQEGKETHQRIASPESTCSGLGEIEAPDHAQQYWYWLELAADHGSVAAMIEYSGNVIPTWPAVTGRERFGGNWPSALGDAEKIIRYRDKAVGYLQRALDMGFPHALMATAMEYTESGSLYPPDPVRAFAYTLAFQAAVTTDFGGKQAVFHLSRLAARLTDAQIAEAERLSVDILGDFYDGSAE